MKRCRNGAHQMRFTLSGTISPKPRMKAAIVYHSEHHGNTKKVVDAIVIQCDVALFEASGGGLSDLSGYDLIGFASGICYQKFLEDVLQFAEKNLPQGKKVLFIYTCGVKRKGYIDAIKHIADAKGARR